MTVVIPCAGHGLRMGKSRSFPKCLLNVGNRTVLERIVRYWERWTDEILLICPPDSRAIEGEARRLGVRYRTVIQEKPDGIGAALALAEGKTSARFIVALGDCLLKGEFDVKRFPRRAIGVWEKGDPQSIRLNYGVELMRGAIVSLREKPRSAKGYLCGMGAYFFDEVIFDIIRGMKPPEGGCLGITPLLSTALKCRYGLEPVFFHGAYVNINAPSDLRKARALFSDE